MGMGGIEGGGGIWGGRSDVGWGWEDMGDDAEEWGMWVTLNEFGREKG